LSNKLWDNNTEVGGGDIVTEKLLKDGSDVEGVVGGETGFEGGVDAETGHVSLERMSCRVSDWECSWVWVDRGHGFVCIVESSVNGHLEGAIGGDLCVCGHLRVISSDSS